MTSEQLYTILKGWRPNPRLKVEVAGVSHRGRAIPAAIISAPDNIKDLARLKDMSRRAMSPVLVGSTLRELKLVSERVPPKFVPAVLVIGASFGHEASHVEGLTRVIEMLITGADETTRRILERLVVVAVPLVNPDGREQAIEEWKQTRYSSGCEGSGNAYGFLLNRDYMSLTQPEATAVFKLFSEWQPIAALDVHEDKYRLGISMEEVCWTPPFLKPDPDYVDPSIVRLIDELGASIASQWATRQFHTLYDPSGRRSFLPLGGRGGTFHLVTSVHGCPSLITESARAPGTQTWTDRVEQKTSACLAFLSRVASMRDEFVDVSHSYRTTVLNPGGVRLGYAIFEDQEDPHMCRLLLDTLRKHGVGFYSIENPRRAYLIPGNRPCGLVGESLLSDKGVNQYSLAEAYGVQAMAIDKLRPRIRESLLNACLTAVDQLPPPTCQLVPPVPADRKAIALRNVISSVRVVNKLLREGVPVSQMAGGGPGAENGLRKGTFVIGSEAADAIERVSEGIETRMLPLGEPPTPTVALRIPKIALYSGVGTRDRNLVHVADIRWGLDFMAFPFEEVSEQDILAGDLERFDVLVVPAGDVKEMLRGQREGIVHSEYQFETFNMSEGLGNRGVRKIGEFVDRGGCYIGIGSGGGALACKETLGWMDIRAKPSSMQPGVFYIRIESTANPVVWSFEGCLDEHNDFVSGIVPVYFYTEPEPRYGMIGVPSFEPTTSGVEVLARYVAAPPLVKSGIGTPSRALAESDLGSPAILAQKVGRGYSIVFGFSIGFRAAWMNSHKFISNSLYCAAAKTRTAGTLWESANGVVH
jgi:hypothetical protein